MESSKADFKAPPALDKNISYTKWKKELAIWEAFTNLEAKKRAPAIFLTLQGQAREAVLEMDIDKLNCNDGVKELLLTLDSLYLKDECSMAYEAYEAFEKYIRPEDSSISDYIIHFERLYNKAKSYKMEIHDGVLAYRLLNNANISDTHKQLIRATVSEMNYKNMKEQLNKIFSSITSKCDTESIKIKSESAFLASDNQSEPDTSENEEAYVSFNYKGRGNSRGNFRRGNYRGRGHWRGKSKPQDNEKTTPSKKPQSSDQNEKKKDTSSLNPTNYYGQIKRCRVCDSQYHLINECPELEKEL